MTETIRFACQPGCTKCCDMEGFVYLTEADLNKAAKFLNLTPEEFEKRYVYRTAHQRRLRKPRASQCTFLTAEGCSIHSVKPTQCRLFPRARRGIAQKPRRAKPAQIRHVNVATLCLQQRHYRSIGLDIVGKTMHQKNRRPRVLVA